ncbi:hypothetical protein [Paenibacillus sp. GCM10027626]|uniref:hypothetical protein n=1 Tax=Paenibacillus sp. GCM10027626 TaxID=3273411 RepID=UPI00362FBA19
MDKRIGRRTIGERVPIEPAGPPSYTLDEAIKVKRAKNLKDRTINGSEQQA